MNIQWYPGHMAKAKREIQKNLKLVDVVMELRDARIPESSKNPQIDEIIQHKPKIVILNKVDLADPKVTDQWIQHFHKMGQQVVLINSVDGKGIKDLLNAVNDTLQDKIKRQKSKGLKNIVIRCMILGIPNVGKSTLINKISGKAGAKTGNLPGVTKSNQWIKMNDQLLLLDTPGILWPKFDDPFTGLKLAWTSAIKHTIYDRETAALRLLDYMMEHYKDRLEERFQLSIEEGTESIDLYEAIAKKRGFIFKGGEIDYARAGETILDEVHKGKLGRLSYEKPQDFQEEQ
ncbi:MAG TPA: ribosome biogenesis GTPase YlqF [Eubacteriaceae bacterium]|nr:ribosome biogenesis GTPase YlqF [Eubacteriaceae bacterium]